MALDSTSNFAKSAVSTGYDQNAYSIVLATGGGAKMPAPPFNITWWNSTDYSDPGDDPNVEIDRVTGVSGDTLTLANNGTSRTAQEGTTASTKNTSGKTYMVMAGLTKKTMDDLATALSTLNTFKMAPTSGSVDGSNTQFGFTQEPTFIVSDGAWYTVNEGFTWNSGTNIATLTIPPNNSIYGFA